MTVEILKSKFEILNKSEIQNPKPENPVVISIWAFEFV